MFIRIIALLAGAVAVAAIAGADSFAEASQSPSQAAAQQMTTMLLKATAQRDFAKFVENGTPQFKAAMTKEQFDAVCDQVSARLTPGFTLSLIRQSTVEGFAVSAWRVQFAAGGSIVAQVAEKDAQVGGFYLKPDTVTPTNPAADKRMTEMLLDATAHRDFAEFVKDGTPQFKAAMTRKLFDTVCDQVSAQLKAGYTLACTGQTSALGFTVTTWQVKFDKSGARIIAQLAEQNAKVGGFYLKPDVSQ